MTSEPKRRDDFNSDIDFGEAPFVDLGWHIMQVAVMPVVHVRRGTFRSVGSCFGITNDGLCVTARHVIEDAFGAIAPSPDLIELDDERGYIAALYVSDEVHPDNPSQIVGGLLPMHRVYFNDGMDVALLKLNLPTDTRTGKTIFFPSHRLRMDFPVPGEPFFATGYREAEWSMGKAAPGARARPSLLCNQGEGGGGAHWRPGSGRDALSVFPDVSPVRWRDERRSARGSFRKRLWRGVFVVRYGRDRRSHLLRLPDWPGARHPSGNARPRRDRPAGLSVGPGRRQRNRRGGRCEPSGSERRPNHHHLRMWPHAEKRPPKLGMRHSGTSVDETNVWRSSAR